MRHLNALKVVLVVESAKLQKYARAYLDGPDLIALCHRASNYTIAQVILINHRKRAGIGAL